MRVGSRFPVASVLRRVPRQERGAFRVAALLKAAAESIGHDGYESATMSEIAARAGASIGSLYQFFPNKEALALTLQESYLRDLGHLWAKLEERAASLTAKELGSRLVDEAVTFLEEHPALIALCEARIGRRNLAIRQLLRDRLARILLATSARLSKSKTVTVSHVTLEIVKSMNELYVEARGAERRAVTDEMKYLLACYLDSRIAAVKPRHSTKK